MSMTKAQLKAAIAELTDLPKTDVELVLSALPVAVAAGLAGRGDQKVNISGLAIFKKKHQKARTMTIPMTGEKKRIPAGYRVRASASKKLKDLV